MTQKQPDTRPQCPEVLSDGTICGRPMCKAGMGWSGRTKRQLFLCQSCGRRIMEKRKE